MAGQRFWTGTRADRAIFCTPLRSLARGVHYWRSRFTLRRNTAMSRNCRGNGEAALRHGRSVERKSL